MNEDDMKDDEIFGPYIAAEAETLRRYEDGEPLDTGALLMLLLLLLVDVAVMNESVEEVTKIAKPLTDDRELWTVLDGLRGHIAAVHGRFQRWQTTFLRADYDA